MITLYGQAKNIYVVPGFDVKSYALNLFRSRNVESGSTWVSRCVIRNEARRMAWQYIKKAKRVRDNNDFPPEKGW